MAEDWTPAVRILDRPNGTAGQARPNPLRRERWLPLGDLYPGHQVLLRFNPSRQGATPLPEDASDLEKIRYGLKLIVRDHRVHFGDGTSDSPWIDPDTDQPLPSPQTDEFWELIGNDILSVILAHVAADQKKVSASIEQSSGMSIEALRARPVPSPSGMSGD